VKETPKSVTSGLAAETDSRASGFLSAYQRAAV